MSTRAHWYRDGGRGRSLGSASGRSGTLLNAHVQCSRCPNVGDVGLRAVPPPEQIDKKFAQKGWALDPNLCPDCRRKPAKEKLDMTVKTSPAAMRAQVEMITLLQTHFDPERGAYALGWSDEAVAKKSGISRDAVVEYREAGFGKLKEPPEIQLLKNDLAAAKSLLDETTTSLRNEIDAITRRLADVSKRWAA